PMEVTGMRSASHHVFADHAAWTGGPSTTRSRPWMPTTAAPARPSSSSSWASKPRGARWAVVNGLDHVGEPRGYAGAPPTLPCHDDRRHHRRPTAGRAGGLGGG